ncbi:MAG: M20/M25/M40 family metallo-hydrolase [Candidatus Sericytochromatia bacterium]|nr:M20/M25/M40 family metallo-hydrolase [Candidatus Tanganyikabacteria bacterium]
MMHARLAWVMAGCALGLSGAAAGYPVPAGHDLVVRLDPAAGTIGVRDTITLAAPVARGGGELTFRLHGGLRPESRTIGVTVARVAASEAAAHGQNAAGDAAVPVETFRVRLVPGARAFELEYGGRVHHPPREQGEEYARSFKESPGTVGTDGVYLAGSTFWYPRFGDDELLPFGLECRVPAGWKALSQGRRTLTAAASDEGAFRWVSPEPQDEIYLVAGRWTEYARKVGDIDALALLREPDQTLADRYLDATAEYLLLYERLFGPYAYGKFALVENFWETGYGMPSFTLLGPKIIRFPFILRTSYPHEILHNWWGNSVFVDYDQGNWCEGLTAYLADHLLAEQDGGGAAYRRATLQRYSEFVKGARDFPLTAFRGRHSSVTEAVGYGKSLLFFHMARRALGDDAFLAALRRFYREKRGRRATFGDLERAFAAEGDPAVAPEFGRWVRSVGAPELRVRDVRALREGEAWRLTAILDQAQAGPEFRLGVPVQVRTEGAGDPVRARVDLAGRTARLDLPLSARPLRLDVDPEFDLFRRLQPGEVPPSLARAFAAERALVVVPARAPEPHRAGYRRLAEAWRESQPGQVEVAQDTEVETLPADRTVWVLGRENRHFAEVRRQAARLGADVEGATPRLPSGPLTGEGVAIALALAHPGNPDLALGWVAAERPAALEAVGRKLPHYGKYGFVAFAGADLRAIARGEWAAPDSPLSVAVPDPGTRPAGAAQEGAPVAPEGAPGARVSLAMRAPLPLTLSPSAVSPARLRDGIRHLADSRFAGRGLGTPELDAAADYLAAQFRSAGLEPGGDAPGSYFQAFRPTLPAGAPPVDGAKNVVGLLRGKRPEWASQSVVIGAHYDHLGRGWPDVHAGDAGKIHPGAADNASGVAALLEVARLAGAGWRPERTLVFVAFTGEEAGRLGSRHFVDAPGRYPAADCLAMVNLDAVGRFGDRAVTAFGTETWGRWPDLLAEASRRAGVATRPVARAVAASDDQSFVAAGVPALHLHTGPNPDYHRPGDTADKVEPEAVAAAARLAGHLALRLSSLPPEARPSHPPAATPASGSQAAARSSGPLPTATSSGSPPAAPSSGLPAEAALLPARRVSLGTMPDLAFGGTGCRVASVTPGSPAAAAGILPGDVIVGVEDFEIAGPRDLAKALSGRLPGDLVSIALMRDGRLYRIEARLVAR